MELEAANQQNIGLMEEVKVLSVKVKEERDKNRALWRLHCEKLAEYDEQITTKEEEVAALERRIAASGAAAHEPPHTAPGHNAFGESPVVADTHEPEGTRHRLEPRVTGGSVSATARSLAAKELSGPAGRGTSTDFTGHSPVCSNVVGGGTIEPRASCMASDSATKSEPTGCKITGPAAVHGHGLANAEGLRRGKAPPCRPL